MDPVTIGAVLATRGSSNLDMTRDEAELALTQWVSVTRDRDNRVRAAVAAGLTKHRVHHVTGIGRSTIDRILAQPADTKCAKTVPNRGRNDH